MIRQFSLLVAVVIGLAGAVWADDTLRDTRPRPLDKAMDAMRDGDWRNAARIAARDGAVARDVIEWHRLRAGQGSYAQVMAFLERRADWPGLEFLRKRSEGVVIAEGREAVLAFFAGSPAQTVTGALAHAAALSATGKANEARAVIADVWLGWEMSDSEHALMMSTHSGVLKPLHEARLDAMLWRGAHKDARRMFKLVGKDRTALAQARIGLRNRVGNVDALVAAVPKALQDDPGLVHARFEWRVRKGRWDEAKELLLAQSVSAAKLGNPAGWANRRRVLARDELRDGSAAKAYQMAARHHLTSGSSYADLEWLAGYIALTKLDDPAQALVHFENHDRVVESPISQGRAGYWKGRAHAALGDAAAADMEYTKGAAYQTSFYGLLAAEAAGLPFDVGIADVPVEVWQTSPLIEDSVFQAGMLLAASGERNLAERFWRHLAEQLGDHDAALLGQAAIDMGEPHLAVMIGKSVARRGAIVPMPYYPLHPLAEGELPVAKELALAIARRESEFDPVVVSGAGARGLMQLMPATAKEVASQLGLSEDHSTDRLTDDPVYNAVLGTRFLATLSERFGGNVVMVSAAYNAGPSRPDRWMRLYGDPRSGSVEDMIDWIEGIPFRETRNYVMRVAESLPIYRARLGLEPLPVPFSEELLGDTLGQ